MSNPATPTDPLRPDARYGRARKRLEHAYDEAMGDKDGVFDNRPEIALMEAVLQQAYSRACNGDTAEWREGLLSRAKARDDTPAWLLEALEAGCGEDVTYRAAFEMAKDVSAERRNSKDAETRRENSCTLKQAQAWAEALIGYWRANLDPVLYARLIPGAIERAGAIGLEP